MIDKFRPPYGSDPLRNCFIGSTTNALTDFDTFSATAANYLRKCGAELSSISPIEGRLHLLFVMRGSRSYWSVDVPICAPTHDWSSTWKLAFRAINAKIAAVKKEEG